MGLNLVDQIDGLCVQKFSKSQLFCPASSEIFLQKVIVLQYLSLFYIQNDFNWDSML